eukprot:229821-Amphidinium_carterae.1
MMSSFKFSEDGEVGQTNALRRQRVEQRQGDDVSWRCVHRSCCTGLIEMARNVGQHQLPCNSCICSHTSEPNPFLTRQK